MTGCLVQILNGTSPASRMLTLVCAYVASIAVMQPLYRVLSMTGVLFIFYFGGKNVLGQGWSVATFATFLAGIGRPDRHFHFPPHHGRVGAHYTDSRVIISLQKMPFDTVLAADFARMDFSFLLMYNECNFRIPHDTYSRNFLFHIRILLKDQSILFDREREADLWRRTISGFVWHRKTMQKQF